MVTALTSFPRHVGASEWTVADLLDRFGPILFRRIRHDPEPGMATEDDVVALEAREDRLYELIDGVLVEKPMSARESLLAGLLVTCLNNFARSQRLGFVLGPDGMWHLKAGLVRFPEVAFFARADAPGGRFPKGTMIHFAPRLAIEVLSPSNTAREMDGKLREYFAAGVRLVWFIDPDARSVRVFSAPDTWTDLDESQSLDGGDILPGFTLALSTLFEELTDTE